MPDRDIGIGREDRLGLFRHLVQPISPLVEHGDHVQTVLTEQLDGKRRLFRTVRHGCEFLRQIQQHLLSWANLPLRIQRRHTERLERSTAFATLDLGIDWGAVDLVIQVGAPKGCSRMVQRIGRANHRYNAPSKALILPANRFEVVECRAALDAVRDHTLDGEPRGPGPRDVLCQHILLTAAAGPFDADALYEEVVNAGPYAALTRAEFDACLDFTATGGYALRAYDRWQRLMERNGLWQLRDPRAAAVIRQNLGTIIDIETLKVRLGRFGTPLGEVEESFAATLTPGDTFLIGGEVVRYEGLREMTVEVSRTPGRDPKVAVFSGTKFATSTQLSERVLQILQQPDWPDLPAHTNDWLSLQRGSWLRHGWPLRTKAAGL